MGNESIPAINAQQFYVSVSRGREKATVYSDLPVAELRQLIQRADNRKAATELMGHTTPKRTDRLRTLARRTSAAFRQLREKAAEIFRDFSFERERSNAGLQR
jgi:hypothetical protein